MEQKNGRTRRYVGVIAAAAVLAACGGGDGGGGTTDPQLGGIRGSVVNQTNAGMANVTVTATKGSSVRTATTTNAGEFTFSSLETGSWALAVAVPAGFELATGENGTRSVVVTAGQNAQAQTFMLRVAGGGGPTTGTISGTVSATSGGIPNVVINLTGVTAPQTTNASGQYSFTNVTPGERTLTLSVPAGFTLAAGQTAQKSTTVTAGQTATVNWTLEAESGGTVTAVSMQNTAFSPANVTIAVGGTVRWTNMDPIAHNVRGDNNAFSSANLQQNGTFSFTFNSAGSFPYQCTLHTGMNGTVTVQ